MKRSSKGYTLVEVMAAIAIMGAGLLGIISLQGAAVAANSRANQITIATNLARRWQDRLRRDSYQWNNPSQLVTISNIGDTWYLRAMGTTTQAPTGWILPPAVPTGITADTETAAFDSFGRDVALTSPDVFYCTHIRLTPLITNQLVRAEVRVWWFREGGVRPTSYAACGSTADLNMMGRDTTNVHWVYMSQTLERHEL